MPNPPVDDFQYLDLGDYLTLAAAAADTAEVEEWIRRQLQ
jgi:hypothetical protein